MLHVQNLSYRRGNTWLFKGFGMRLAAGQISWLRGPNGSGKTSLMRLILGLAQPDTGQVFWQGNPLPVAVNFANQLVYIGHTYGLKEDLTALEALEFLDRLHARNSNLPQLKEALHKLGVLHRQSQAIRVLSQGQRKRVALARLALETLPGLWVLDEPYDALDAEGSATLNKLLEEHSVRGGCVLLTSHIPVSIRGVQVSELSLEQRVNP